MKTMPRLMLEEIARKGNRSITIEINPGVRFGRIRGEDLRTMNLEPLPLRNVYLSNSPGFGTLVHVCENVPEDMGFFTIQDGEVVYTVYGPDRILVKPRGGGPYYIGSQIVTGRGLRPGEFTAMTGDSVVLGFPEMRHRYVVTVVD